ncbi:hypothetical protein CHUAL_008311 [Chamberlinius hualienensis]
MISTNLIFIFLISSSYVVFGKVVDPPCCEIDPTCGWVSGGGNWVFSATGSYPDTTNYPNFYSTEPPYNPPYAWIQDRSGALSSTASFTINSITDTFAFDYYFNVIDIPTTCYLNVVLNINGVVTPVIASITVPYDGWRSYTLKCDNTNDYCCGGKDKFPCSGQIEFDTNYDTRPNEGLAAVTNFGCSSIITSTTKTSTTTTPTPFPFTLPPPIPSECCTFETNVCGFSSPANNWYWSVFVLPSYLPPPPRIYTAPNYLWTNQNGAIANTLPQTIQPTTTFALSYYITSGATLTISFVDSVGNRYPINALYYTAGNWQHHTIYVRSIPVPSPNSGHFVFEATSITFPFTVAIDDVEKDGQCHGSFPCCYFDDPFICDLIPYPVPIPPYEWKWSGSSTPMYPIPDPTPPSQYVYFETSGYTGPEFSASLRTNLIEIDYSVTFRGNFFSYTPTGHDGLQSLEVNFWESSTGTVTNMQTVKLTYGVWEEVDFQCRSVNGDCCQGAMTCTGYLEFAATVQDAGGTVAYGIDAIDINNICPIFPGLAMISSNGTETHIPLKLHSP